LGAVCNDHFYRENVNFKNNFFESIGMTRPVLALSAARLADAMGNSILFILIPLYIAKIPHDYFHFAVPILVGILVSIFGFVNSFLQPLMGALSDHLGRRKLLIQLGLAVIGLSTIAFVFAGNYTALLLLRILQGVGIALTIPASLSLMTAITVKESRGGSMGIFTTFRMIGFAIGPLIGGFLQVHYGFNTAFYVGAGLIFLSMFLVQIWVEDIPIIYDGSKPRRFRIIDLSLLSPGIISAATATFTMASAFSMVTTLENEFNARLDITAIGFSIAFSMLMVGRLIFQIPLGRYSDKIGRKPLILIGLILMAITTALLGESATLTQMIILRLIQGVAAAAIAAPAFAVAADLAKSGGEGRQMSVITMGFGLGIAAGPLLAGLLAVIFFELPFIVIGAMSLAGALVVLRYLPETVKSEKTLFTPHN